MSGVSGKYERVEEKTVSDNVQDLWSSYSPNFKYPHAGLVAPGFKCG